MITKRQDVVFDDGFDDRGRQIFICDKSCQNANIAKWSVFLGLFTLIFVWLTVGFWHARYRVRKGQKPMLYHRWLAPKQKSNPAGFYNTAPPQPPPSSYYGMQAYPEPPPMYNPQGMPPAYMPPPPMNKSAPLQNGFVPPPNPASQGRGSAPQLPPIPITQ